MKRYEKYVAKLIEKEFSDFQKNEVAPLCFRGTLLLMARYGASGYITSGCFCATRLIRKALKDGGTLPTSMRSFVACLQLPAPENHLKRHGIGMW